MEYALNKELLVKFGVESGKLLSSLQRVLLTVVGLTSKDSKTVKKVRDATEKMLESMDQIFTGE